MSLASIGLMALLPVVSSDTCVPVCEVRTVGDRALLKFAFFPPALVVQTGSTVSWSALDGAAHTATDTASGCFHVSFAPAGGNTGRALFFIAEGTLFGQVGSGAPEPCTAAIGVADGGFVLPYKCLAHSDMFGEIMVR